MVGGGNRKDDAIAINSTNVFAALGSLKKKKKDKETQAEKEQVFWAPAPLTVKSWADVDDEDDDDYYATTAPPPVWGAGAGMQQEKIKGNETPVEESESEIEEEGLDEIDDDNDEENDHDQKKKFKSLLKKRGYA
ncbi:hypothetical protein E3N88_43196 [Mikania micrantha]|uniref:Uncharacterized protein n=1 Tax=Mikania micrantha TaxID=192012 RepID=A0A5N6LFM7_9ASTR|nr:hypothetical protein E3N88_43196 [Mikania micrantha]